MDAFNRTLIDVSRESRVDYIDLASMLPKDTSTFYDDAHFNDSGSDKVATAIAGFMAARISGSAVQTADVLSRGPRAKPLAIP